MEFLKDIIITLATVLISSQILKTEAKPERFYAKGYRESTLPEGGWTQWFNSDHPSMFGDYETVERIHREYGRGCEGIPCKRPLAIKVMSTRGLTPHEEQNVVHIHVRKGLICREHEQHYKPCANYKVRFYCPGMYVKCHGGLPNDATEEIVEGNITEKNDELLRKENMRKQENEVIGYFIKDDNIHVEQPDSVKLPGNHMPRINLPHLRGSKTHVSDNEKRTPSQFQDSAPSVNSKGDSRATSHLSPEGHDSTYYRHFPYHPRGALLNGLK